MFISETWLYTILGIVAAVAVGLLLVLTAPEAPDAAAPESPAPAGTPTTPTEPEPTPAAVGRTDEPAIPAPPAAEPAAPTAAYAVDGFVRPGEYRNMLDGDGFQVHWMNDRSLLRIGLVSQGTGYVGIGFDPKGRMEGANFILGAVNGIAVSMRDDFGIGSTTHAADTSQGGTHDILEAAGREIGGRTTFEFVIPLDSGDPMDVPLEPGMTYRILVAYHMMNDSFGAVHSRTGLGEIRLDPVP